jgi:hypothetical protein
MVPINYAILLTANFLYRFQVYDIDPQFHDVNEKVIWLVVFVLAFKYLFVHSASYKVQR